MTKYNMDGSVCMQPSTSDREGFTFGGMDFTTIKKYPVADDPKHKAKTPAVLITTLVGFLPLLLLL